MNDWRTLYHRSFAVVAAAVLWSYAGFSISLGRVFVPYRYGSRGVNPLWSAERTWHSFDGVAAVLMIAAFVVVGAGLLLLPAPASTQERFIAQSRRQSAARLLLLAGAALAVMAIMSAVVIGSRWSTAGQDIDAIRQWVRDRQDVQRRFDDMKILWGLLLAVVLTGAVIDLMLRRSSSGAE